jgi:hypothetical protein
MRSERERGNAHSRALPVLDAERAIDIAIKNLDQAKKVRLRHPELVKYAEKALGNREYFLNKPYSIGGGRKDHVP